MTSIVLPPFGSGKNKYPYQIIVDHKPIDLIVYAPSLGASEEYLDSHKFSKDLIDWNPTIAQRLMFCQVVIEHNWAAEWRKSLDVPESFRCGMAQAEGGKLLDLDQVISDSMREDVKQLIKTEDGMIDQIIINSLKS
jgi:hypothetical protein